MKKLPLLLIILTMLTSCGIQITLPYLSSVTSSNVTSSNSINTSSSSSLSSSVSINTNVSIDTSKLNNLTLDDNISIDFGYNTGSYARFRSGVYFECYRTYRSSSELLHFVPYTSNNSVEGLASSLCNTDPIYGIKKIEIEYKTNDLTGEKPLLKVGESRFYTFSTELNLTTSYQTTSVSFEQDSINFFSIECASMKTWINKVKIYYTNDSSNYTSVSKQKVNEGEYRINIPTLDSSSLVSGVTKATVPVKVSFVDNECVVEESRTYTYYSYNDVINNQSLIDDATWTDPIDVSNYFVSFGTYPVNYVVKNNYKSNTQYFGSNTRCVSTYDRTDGYANYVPFEVGSNDKPFYYECDVALDSTYSSSKRGVGRLVIWDYGFSASKGAIGYSSSPVVVYTDDHYATFREYFNCGIFGDNFDAEKNRVHKIWSCPTTVEIVK